MHVVDLPICPDLYASRSLTMSYVILAQRNSSIATLEEIRVGCA